MSNLNFVIETVCRRPPVAEGGRHNDILCRMGPLVANGASEEVAVAAVGELYPDGSGKRPITHKEKVDCYHAAKRFNDKPWTFGSTEYHRHGDNRHDRQQANQPIQPVIKPFMPTGESKPLPPDLGVSSVEFFTKIFEPDDLICIAGPNAEGNPTKPYIYTLQELQTRTKPYASPFGLWYCINSMSHRDLEDLNKINPLPEGVEPRKSPRCDDNIEAYRHCLVELEVPKDKRASLSEEDRILRLGQFYAALIDSGLPLKAIYGSGSGYSIHALVRIDARTEAEFKQRVAKVYTYADNLPGLDAGRKAPSQLSRLPGALHDGKCQALLSWAIGPKSWEEWEGVLEKESDDTEWFDLGGLMLFDRKHDPNCLIGDRWICRGGSLILQGDTGMGKSSFILQAAMTWAMNRPFFGIKPKRKLKIVLIQAENDSGDLAEPFQDIAKHALRISVDSEEMIALKQNLIIGRQAAKAGARVFAEYVRTLITRFHPDLVIVDPLLSYFGSAISDQEAASLFFRNHLQPIQNETGVIFVFVHHVGKPPKAGEQRQGPSLYLGLGSSDIMNWAREIVTMTHCGDGVYKVEFGKRADRSGVVNSAGEKVSEVFVQRGANGLRYWSLSENINSTEDAKHAADRKQREKIRVFIARWGTVTLAQLKQHASQLGYGINTVKAAADILVSESEETEQPIFSYSHAVEGQSGGPPPKLYSIQPEPEQSVRVVVRVIGQMELISERKDLDW